MKKRLGIAIVTICTLLAGGCGGSEQPEVGSRTSTTTTVDDVLEQRLKESGIEVRSTGDGKEEAAPTPTPEPTAVPTAAPTPLPEESLLAEEGLTEEELAALIGGTEGVDVDLTVLNANLVYSEVYNMMVMPENYVGKSIKMNGIYTYYKDEATGMEYYACIIRDAMACCAQGVEFVPTDPALLPQEGGDVTVVGVFDTYQEGEYMYCTLRDAQIL